MTTKAACLLAFRQGPGGDRLRETTAAACQSGFIRRSERAFATGVPLFAALVTACPFSARFESHHNLSSGFGN